jgi:hypothetical protein
VVRHAGIPQQLGNLDGIDRCSQIAITMSC